ncbi:hypothetical protein WICPIJ_000506 [Wickerhamomyces pijperi]|uniref:Chromatin structure-remodeling complex protein RSC58 n=1 Tax=Wickerhamomyces pijperi TaxID=599730 RepID=A0A9P8TRQ6_WICPI|nr:hypothetical protein WICPIJ_000506 [Wickerhamomyces pijperi]
MSQTRKFEQFELPQLLKDITVVLKTASKESDVLSTSIPSEFLESQPLLIAQSFIQYLNENEEFSLTSVNERLDQAFYTSVYQLYHDIRLSAFIQLNQLPIGSEKYVLVDKFYKFATEFILRESFRLAADLHEFNTRPTDESEFESLISEDFVKISTTYTLANNEAYFTYTSGNIPLFTSLTQRSSLDERNITLAPELHLTTVLPHTVAPTATISQNLDSVCPLPARILSQQQQQQQMSIQPTFPNTGSLQPYPMSDILDRFLHPNWYSLPASKWLANSDLQSFAPCVDDQIAVVTSEDKARLWFETVGYGKLFSISKELETNIDDNDLVADDGDAGDSAMDVDEQQLVLDDIQFSEEESKPTKGSINLANLFEWDPANTLTLAELEIFEKGEEEEYINSLISKLAYLKSMRKPKVPATEEEVQIYHKINFLLKEIILNSNEVPTLQVSKNLPILQTNYNGVLPAPNHVSLKKKSKASRR